MKNRVEQLQNCWKIYGVWGKASPRCAKLAEVIHCRHCQVFTQAGRNLLERDLPAAYTKEWTQVLATQQPLDELGDTLSVLIFRIETEWLALPIQLFAEIIPIAPTHTIPHRNNPVLIGVANVHGEIQLCVSLRELLGIEVERVKNKDHRQLYKRMMVIHRDDERWVFPVDEIHGIHRVDVNKLQNAPVTLSKLESALTKGIFKWQDQYVAFLDEELLLYKLARSVQ